MKIILSVIPSDEMGDRKRQCKRKLALLGGNQVLIGKMLTTRDFTLTTEWSFLLSQTFRSGHDLTNIKVMKMRLEGLIIRPVSFGVHKMGR